MLVFDFLSRAPSHLCDVSSNDGSPQNLFERRPPQDGRANGQLWWLGHARRVSGYRWGHRGASRGAEDSIRMSPRWLTSKTPTPVRTAGCSAMSPPVAGYSTGMSQPPKLTIRAPILRWTAFKEVLRRTVVTGDVTEMARGPRKKIKN